MSTLIEEALLELAAEGKPAVVALVKTQALPSSGEPTFAPLAFEPLAANIDPLTGELPLY